MDIVSDIVANGHVLVLHGDFDVRSTWAVSYTHLTLPTICSV